MEWGAGDFGSDVRLNLCFLRGQVEARRAVNAIGVEQRQGRHTELGAGCCQFLGQGCAFEKAESRAGMKFDVQVLSSRFSKTVRPLRSYWRLRDENGNSNSVIRSFHEPSAA